MSQRQKTKKTREQTRKAKNGFEVTPIPADILDENTLQGNPLDGTTV